MKLTKITTVIGTRPEIIRMSELIKKFDKLFEHRLIHTGQNSDPNLNEVFFKDLELRSPDQYLSVRQGGLGAFLGNLFVAVEIELTNNRPDAVVILGDTNSALTAIIAKRFGIPVYHLEAGNRSFDANVPEEINRKIVDHTSDFNLPYSELARQNLLNEGIHPRKIALSGTPLVEVINTHKHKISKSQALEKLNLNKGQYFLASIHRQENVDYNERLSKLLGALVGIFETYNLPVLVSTHPRTRKQIGSDKSAFPGILFHEPFGFIDYLALQKNARLVLSDSGTISEESAILDFPAITIRDSMERPEALEAGSIVMAGIEKNQILEAINLVENSGLSKNYPLEYQIPDFSTRVTNFILSTVHKHKLWNGLYSNS